MNTLSPKSPSHDPRSMLWMLPRENYARVGKYWRQTSEGPRKTAERPGKTYWTERAPADGIESVYQAVEYAQQRRDGFFAYGGLTSDGELRRQRNTPIRRNKEDKPEQSANIEEVPRHWLILDIDDVPCSTPHSMGEHSGREAAVCKLVKTLPDALKHTSVVYQWTGSAGVLGWDVLKLRLFFWLEAPLLPSQMKQWLRYSRVQTDLAIYSPNQPIYVAAPKWDRVTPPLKSSERVGLLRSRYDVVAIPDSELQLAKDLDKSISNTGKAPRQVSRSSSAWKPMPYPHERDELTMTGDAHLRLALSSLRSPSGSRHNAVRLAARKLVGPAVQAGHLSRELGRSVLLDAAGRLGLAGERGRQVEGAIDWAFSKAQPIAPPAPSEARIKWGADHSTSDIRYGGEARIEPWLDEVIRQAKAHPDQLHLAIIPAGVGKTHNAIREAVKAVRAGESRVILTRTIALAEEVADTARELGGIARIIKGALHHCLIVEDYETDLREGDEGAALLLSNLRAAYAEGGRDGLCGRMDDPVERCPHARSCEGAIKPTIEPGELIVTTHDMAAHIELPDDVVIYWDEAPREYVSKEETALPALLSLRIQEGHSIWARWSQRVHEGGLLEAALKEAAQLLNRVAASTLASDYETHLAPADLEVEELPALAALGEAIKADEAHHAAALERWAKLNRWEQERRRLTNRKPQLTFSAPPRQMAIGARAGQRPRIPSRRAFRLLCDLAISAAEGSWRDDLGISISPEGVARFARYRLAQLPKKGAAIALDATGASTLTGWRGIARDAGREVEVHQLPCIGGAPESLWVSGGAYRTGQLWKTVRGERVWETRAKGAIAKAAEQLAEMLADGEVESLGIITHKPLADLIRAGLEYDGHSAQRYATDPTAKKILEGELIRLLRAHIINGGEVSVGHYGADDIGSNRMAGVDALAMIGSPSPDYAAATLSLRMLGVGELTGDELEPYLALPEETRVQALRIYEEREVARAYRELIQARMSQCFARLRSIRREDTPRLLYLGHIEPLRVDPAVPGICWRKCDTGRAKARSPHVVQIEHRAEQQWADEQSLPSLGDMQREGLTRNEARGVQTRVKASNGGGCGSCLSIDGHPKHPPREPLPEWAQRYLQQPTIRELGPPRVQLPLADDYRPFRPKREPPRRGSSWEEARG